MEKHFFTYSLEDYAGELFNSPITFLANNHVYFDNEALLNIKKLVMVNLDKKNASQEVKDEVADRIDLNISMYNAFYNVDVKDGKEIMIQELDDIFNSCIDLAKEASKNVKENTCKKTIDDYYKSFLDNIDKVREFGSGIEESDIVFLMFVAIRICKFNGGDFYMIDALYDKLGEYLEANHKD